MILPIQNIEIKVQEIWSISPEVRSLNQLSSRVVSFNYLPAYGGSLQVAIDQCPEPAFLPAFSGHFYR